MSGGKRRSIARAWLLLLPLVAPLVAGPVAAQNPDPERAALQQRYDALFEQMLANPADLETMFAFAETAAALGNYDQAISTLERMLMFNPNLPRVRLELGALYLRVGAPEAARAYFTQALEADDVPPPVRERVQAYLEQIDRLQSRHWFGGSVFAGLRFQTNANAGPNSTRVRVGGGDAFLADRFTADEDFNAFLSGALIHRYDLDTKDGDYWESRLLGYGSKQFDLSDLDLAVIEGETGPRLTIVPGTTLRPFGLANTVMLGEDQLFTTFGGGFEVEHQFNDSTLGFARYTGVYKDFHNSSENPTANDQTGAEHEMRLGLRYRAYEDLLLSAEGWFLHDDSRRDYFTNDEYGLSLGVQHIYPAPFDLTEVPWMISLTATGMLRDYEAADPLIDPDEQRFDREYRITLENSFRIRNDFSIEAQIQRSENSSTLPNFERENWSFLLGALWTF